MTDRRDLLKLLGAAGSGSLAGCTRARGLIDRVREEIGGGHGGHGTTPAPGSGLETALAQVEERAKATGAPNPEFSFDYEPVDATVDDGTFRRVTGRPADQARGDRLRVVPSSRPAEEVRELLHDVWGIGDATERVRADVAGRTVTFAGAEGLEFVALSVVVDGTVLVARGPDLPAAERVASRWPDSMAPTG